MAYTQQPHCRPLWVNIHGHFTKQAAGGTLARSLARFGVDAVCICVVLRRICKTDGMSQNQESSFRAVLVLCLLFCIASTAPTKLLRTAARASEGPLRRVHDASLLHIAKSGNAAYLITHAPAIHFLGFWDPGTVTPDMTKRTDSKDSAPLRHRFT